MIEHYPFVGVNMSEDLFKKFSYMCARKKQSKSKTLLALILVFTKNVTMDEVNKFYEEIETVNEKQTTPTT